MRHDTGRRFIHVPRAQEVIRAMRAKIAITANTARKKLAHAASANDDLSKAGWSWGGVSVIDSNGRTIRQGLRLGSGFRAF